MSGGIYKPNDRKTYRVWVPWKGKNIFFNRYLDGSPLYHPEQARRILEKIRAEIDQGTFDPAAWGKDKSLHFANAWKVYSEQSACGDARRKARDRICQNYFMPYFKDMNLKEIGEHHVKDWFSRLRPDMAPAYRRLILVTLKAFFRFHAVTRQKAFQYPVVSIPKKVILFLTKEEQDKVFEFIPEWHRPILTLITIYGCRVSEGCNLRKTDIDWERKIITFRERKNREDNELPMTPQVEQALRVPRKIDHYDLVFCTQTGRRYVRQCLYAIWMKANKKAHEKYGIRIVPLKNGTRHSRASQLMEKGEPTSKIARLLGNSEQVVARSYGTIRARALTELLDDCTISLPGRGINT